MPSRTTADAVTTALADADFPADKHALVDAAERGGADADTLGALRGLPNETYDSVRDVIANVSHADEDHETAEQLRAQRRTQHTHDGLSEQDKDVDPVNPIAEELGTNRKR